jgi:hypothetical protein
MPSRACARLEGHDRTADERGITGVSMRTVPVK